MSKEDDVIYEMIALSSLEKVFLDQRPVYNKENLELSGFAKETVSFQVAYYSNYPFREFARVNVESPISEHIKIRSVESVPVTRASMHIVDDNYLRSSPGLYPDLLRDLDCDNTVRIVPGMWQSLWVDIDIDESIPDGHYPISISLALLGDDVGQAKASGKKGQIIGSITTDLRVYGRALPDSDIIHTEWFYADCLADYYKLDVFSDKHWQIISNFLDTYVKLGCNMLLTPLFTYPLDTQVGKERTTCQLIDVKVNDGKYYFSYENLKKWIELAKSKGIKYFEMSHLFSQWGAKYAPKIMADVGGEYKQIFGWHTEAIGEYTEFLKAFIPDLTKQLDDWNVLKQTYFHISDVPSVENYATFKKSYESVKDLFVGLKTFEAISNYDFYKDGLVNIPVAASSVIHDFTEDDIDQLWTYYCLWQFDKVSNRFMSMPLARARILGIQMYKYDIKGFLHWGYNFYNSALSYKKIDPFISTDADGAFPAGDAFLVYPGEDGKALESLRLKAIYNAFTDYRALKYLEKLTNKEYVMKIVESGLAKPLTFYEYPKDSSYIIKLRNRINKEIDNYLN